MNVIKYLLLFLAGILVGYYAIMLVSYLIVMAHFTFTEWMTLPVANWWAIIISGIISFINSCTVDEKDNK